MMINGFTENEIFTLYSFLAFYEVNGLKKSGEKDAQNKFPLLNEIKRITNSFLHKEKNMSELKTLDINTLNDEFYYTTWVSEFMGVLYHMRNSIAHANIQKDGNNVIIIDYDNNKTNPNCTAKGIIRYEIIEKIVDEINKEIQTV